MRARLISVLAVLALTAGLTAGGAAAQDSGRVWPAGGTVGLELVAKG